jgi:RNA recognition motif-containing protein
MSTYKPGDLSRLLNPTLPPPPIVNGKPDPTFFGYLKPTKAPSRKTPKGGGKFSKQHLNQRKKEKQALDRRVREKHETQVERDRVRKELVKEERIKQWEEAKAAHTAKGGKGDAPPRPESESDGEESDAGVDTDDSEIGDELDEDALEDFMKDIEQDDANAAAEGADSDAEAADGAAHPDSNSEAAKARLLRVAKKEKRLAEDAEMDAPLPRKKDLQKQRQENLKHDPRLPRTIFVGNVPTHLKANKLTKWLEGLLGVDSSQQQSIVESVRFRSIAVSDPKLPRKVAIQKGLLHEARDSLNAYVVFTEEKWVGDAVDKCNGKEMELDGKSWRIRVDRMAVTVGEDGAPVAAAVKHDNAHTIFCGNLPFNVNENDLYAHFDNCGDISTVRVIRDRATGMGKGIAFITFTEEQSMRNALASNATKFKGERVLRIMKSVENKKLHKPADAPAAGRGPATKGAALTPRSNIKGAPQGSSAASQAKREGYGGVHKVKELNQAGVLKKPRHVPRDGASGSSSKKKKDRPASAAAAVTPAASTSTPSSSSASSSSVPRVVSRTKRPFEGDHADPTAHIKKQKVDDFKARQKKEKRHEAKKLGGGASSKKKD